MDKKKNSQIECNTENGFGTVIIGEQVIKKIAIIALDDIQGIGLSPNNQKDGIKELFSSNKQNTKGVHVKIDGENNVKISIELVVDYGIDIMELTKTVQEKVKISVENMTGLTVSSVDITIPDVNMF